MKYSSAIVVLCVAPCLYADEITIVNKTPIDLFGARYYVDGSAKRVKEPFLLESGKKKKIKRPALRVGSDREIYFSPDRAVLTKKLSKGKKKIVPHFNTGTLKGDTFYLVYDDGEFKGYHYLEKKIAPLLEKIEDVGQDLTEPLYAALQKSYSSYKHKNDVAHARTDGHVSKEEQSFLNKRKVITKNALEKIVGRSLTEQELPTVALCASGGGYRSMISFLGAIEGLKQEGLFDTVTYMAGLSGGAWGVALSTMLDDPLKNISERLAADLTSHVDMDTFVSQLWKKYVFKQDVSAIDVYGLLLVNQWLRGSYKNPMLVKLSDQIRRMERGERPFPLYSAIIAAEPYGWIEFNPYEVSSHYLRGAIPTWAFGSYFNKGTSHSIAPEQSLGFFMGVCGSAMSMSFKDAFEQMRTKISSPLLRAVLKATTHSEMLAGVRVFSAQIDNFTFGVTTSPWWQQKELTLVDAGLDFNIPLPLLLDRANIIIIFDNSASVLINKAEQLKLAEAYIKKHKIPFPFIDYTHIVEKQCSVFFEKNNPKAPLIIYFPLMSNPRYSPFDIQKCIQTSYCSTNNFNYSAQNIKELSGLARFNVVENSQAIRQAIKEYIAMRGGTTTGL